MKTLMMLVFSLITFSLQAQQISIEDPPEKRAAYLTEEMTEKLKLHEHQLDTIAQLNLKYAKRMQQEIIDQDLNWLTQYNRGMKINNEKEKELFLILDEKQLSLYHAYRKNAMKKVISQALGFE